MNANQARGTNNQVAQHRLGSEPNDKKDVLIRDTQASYEISSSQISTKEMFSCLVAHGCVDLTSRMDPNQSSSGFIVGGGFGDIWKGKLRDGAEVAIKVWRFSSIQHSGPKPMKRAMREIYYWSKVKHKNVQELMGVVIFQGRLGMVSLWMDHGNLREYIGKYPNVERYSLCAQVVAGVVYLHGCKMVHGDIKAANILVSHDGIAKLSDFDHSIMVECSIGFSETSELGGGTPRWMAPELLFDSSVCRNVHTDIYALGMTMLEIITGTIPYYPECREIHHVILAVMQGRLPKRQTTYFDNSPRGNQMWELLLRCWSREPTARPKAGEVHTHLMHCHLRHTSTQRRWNIADLDDEEFLRQLEIRLSRTSGRLRQTRALADFAMGNPDYTDSDTDDSVAEREWIRARRAMMCVREIVRTEKNYLRQLVEFLNGDDASSMSSILAEHLPRLIETSRLFCSKLEEDPSALGVSRAYMEVQELLEATFVQWSSVVGEVTSSIQRRSKNQATGEDGHMNKIKSASSSWYRRRSATASSALQPGFQLNLSMTPVNAGGSKDKKLARGAKGKKITEEDVIVAPTSRAMRYVLMYRDLLLHTPATSASRAHIVHALECATRIARLCDEVERRIILSPTS